MNARAPSLRGNDSTADVCLLLEGTYPYVMGGVSGWTHALLHSIPDLHVAIVAVRAQRTRTPSSYELPGNVVSVTDVYLNERYSGGRATRRSAEAVQRFHRLCRRIFHGGDGQSFEEARELLLSSGLSHGALTDSRAAWVAVRDIYSSSMPTTSLLQFFWAWRTLVSGLIVCLSCELPRARLYHAISTGYAGIIGARAARAGATPLLITEHGIYTNERRIELQVADWLHDTDRAGYAVDGELPEIRDLWLDTFSGFARVAYEAASRITTLYRGNQAFQRADGAPDEKLLVIPNGVDTDRLGTLSPRPSDHTRPTVALIGRVVPIKDIRMFLHACHVLRKRVSEVQVWILGPDDEDPVYAAECRTLVSQLDLDDTIRFLGRVDISTYLPRIDVLALTSLSEAQPLVLLEAGAAGVPSVATDVGSCRELLEGFDGDPVIGHGGVVVNCGDSTAAGNAMIRLLDDADIRTRMGEVMRRRVNTTYDKRTIDARYRQLYERWMTPAERGRVL